MSNTLKPYHPVKTAAAILLMLMFFTCIGLLVWASNKGATINGPVHIAANSARVDINTHAVTPFGDHRVQAILGAPLLGYLGFRHMRNRLGSDSHYLHVQLYNGRHLALNPARLVYTDRMLAYENHLFPIQTGNRKPVYAEGEIETHIAPLLSRATRLGIFAMLRYQFRHREPATIASALYIVTIAAVFRYMGLWRFMFPGK